MPFNPTRFLNAMRTHNKAKKAADHLHQRSSTKKQEKAFQKKTWKFSKSVCENYNVLKAPTFSQDACYNYFKSSYSNKESSYTKLPEWISNVMPISDTEYEFDLSPITPGIIKSTLQNCSTSSSPGRDRNTYFHLRNLPCTHSLLATLFSKILLSSQDAPPSWFQAEIILIPKSGDPSQPSNYRPIALTSVISKLFHKLLAKQLEHFLLDNNIINPSIQNGFLSGINRCVEHILSICSILDNAIQHGLPLAMSFLDLKNAFGSISHSLIHDILDYIKLPTEFVSYITKSYSHLSATIKTKNWCTPIFKIERGVFQGDALSPLIFLAAFNL